MRRNFRLGHVFVFTLALLLGPTVSRANNIVLFNESTHTVYISTQVFEHASQTKSRYDAWVTRGWWSVAPGKAIQIYSGESSMFWMRATYDNWLGSQVTWPNVTVGSAYATSQAFQLESAASDNGLFPAYDVQPDSPHWVYSGNDLTKLGWKLLGGFNHLQSTGSYSITGPKTISSSKQSFQYTANWNQSEIIDHLFQPPPGAKVVYYTSSIGSSQGVNAETWSDPFNSPNGAHLILGLAGSGEFFDQWRGLYSGSVTIYYSYP
jgi:hypothetical protein